MSEKTVPASVAMLRVLQAWDIKRVLDIQVVRLIQR